MRGLPNEHAEPNHDASGGSKSGLPYPTEKPSKEYVVPDRPLADTFHETPGLPDENQNPGWVSPADRRRRG